MAVIAEVQLGAILSRSAHLEKQNKTENEKKKESIQVHAGPPVMKYNKGST